MKTPVPSSLRWTTPGRSSADSMPLGNGDIGINLWVEEDGDLLFYLSKTDCWDENARLLKLGRIRVALRPNPFVAGAEFCQELDLENGAIRILANAGHSAVHLLIWIDANRPVVRVEIKSDEKIHARAMVEMWRTGKRQRGGVEGHCPHGLRSAEDRETVYPDQFLPAAENEILWCHRNQSSCWAATLEHQQLGDGLAGGKDPLQNRTFGAALRAEGLVGDGDGVLRTTAAQSDLLLSIYPLTALTDSLEEWVAALRDSAARCDAAPLPQAFAAHCDWWKDFWGRSWIHITGTPEAEIVSRGYVLQRFITACAGRGAFPIKFNGSIFTVDGEHNGESVDADFRRWGGGYWFQNTRLAYWPMLMAGDFEFFQPWFRMFLDALPLAKLRAERCFGFSDAAMFPETMSFWGTYLNENYGYERTEQHPGLSENTYIRRYWQGMLELIALLLDAYAFTKDEEILKKFLLVLAPPFLKFYREVYPLRDEAGQMVMKPSQSLETWQDAVNPTPDIAGLHWVLDGLLELPEEAVSASQREEWEDFRSLLPPIPTRTYHSAKAQEIIPALQYDDCKNMENPELYPVFPYRFYGVGKPGLAVGIRTFEQRRTKDIGGWDQDPIDAAMLGLTEQAVGRVVKLFSTPNSQSRFPAFWGPNFDWTPDQDHGGVACITLQRMLMQTDDGKILLLPAWPREWNASFRLHAPDRTIVEGRVENGGVLELKVSPETHRERVEIMDKI